MNYQPYGTQCRKVKLKESPVKHLPKADACQRLKLIFQHTVSGNTLFLADIALYTKVNRKRQRL